jgi:selenocysteine lyase/cysteine desulfurase
MTVSRDQRMPEGTPGETAHSDELAAYDAFRQAWPDYQQTARLDAFRASDFERLDALGHSYLDYTGASLYATSHIKRHTSLLLQQVLGNPHSGSPASATATALVEETRREILRYFHASSADYTAVFTQNATAALKLVGEAYPFTPQGRLLLTFDNHNSVNGIREFAFRSKARVEYAPLTVPELRLDQLRLDELLDRANPNARNLFVYPAQSNFSGVRHPLTLVDRARARGWDVLVDAAAFVPTNRLDVDRIHPDFVAVSFYKMFGYPTGVGCLIARREALAALDRPWFSGGTVNFASVQGAAHILAPHEAGFEDGTLNYLSIPAVALGLQQLETLGIDVIKTRVRCLTAWLLERLLEIRHTNGRPIVRLYGPATTVERGGAIALNFYDPEGRLLDYRRVEELAATERISLRTGCFCNPGAGETAEGLTEDDMLAGISAGANITLPRFLQVIQHRSGKSAGAIRVSFGLASNFGDAYRFFRFAAGLRDQTRLTLGDITFDIESCRVIRDGS